MWNVPAVAGTLQWVYLQLVYVPDDDEDVKRPVAHFPREKKEGGH